MEAELHRRTGEAKAHVARSEAQIGEQAARQLQASLDEAAGAHQQEQVEWQRRLEYVEQRARDTAAQANYMLEQQAERAQQAAAQQAQEAQEGRTAHD